MPTPDAQPRPTPRPMPTGGSPGLELKPPVTARRRGEEPARAPAAAPVAVAEPDRGEALIEDVFLAPRVLDRRAFEEYAEALKDLIREASAAERSLSGAAGGVEGLRETLREGTGLLQKKIEAAGRLLPGLDERLKAAEALLSRATDQASLAEAVERRIEAAISARVEALEHRLGETVDRLEARAQAAETRFNAAASRLEQLVAQADHAASVAAETVTKPAVAQVERALEALEARSKAADRQASDLQERFERQSDGALALLERTGQGLASRLAELEAEAETAAAALEARAERVSTALQGPQLAAARALLDRAERLLGRSPERDPNEAPAPGSLLAVLDALQAAGERGRTQGAELAALAEQGARVRDLLREALTEAAGGVDAIERRQEALGRRVREVEDRCRVLDGGTSFIDDRVREALEPAMERLRVRVGEASSWLGTLIERAYEAGRTLHETTTDAAQTRDR